MAEIRGGAANSCIPPLRIRLRHPHDKLANLRHDPAPSELFVPRAVVPHPRHEPSVSSQQGCRCDDTGNFCQEFPAKRLTLYREPRHRSSAVRRSLPPAKPSFEHPVRLGQVDDSACGANSMSSSMSADRAAPSKHCSLLADTRESSAAPGSANRPGARPGRLMGRPMCSSQASQRKSLTASEDDRLSFCTIRDN